MFKPGIQSKGHNTTAYFPPSFPFLSNHRLAIASPTYPDEETPWAEQRIKGVEYKYRPMLAKKSVRIQVQLMKTLSPAIGELQNFLKIMRGHRVINESLLISFGFILSRCDPAEVADLVEDLLSEVQIKRPSSFYDQVDMNADLSGKSDVLHHLLLWVIWEEYGPFFRAVESLGFTVEQRGMEMETNLV